jgi:hypothetical protein
MFGCTTGGGWTTQTIEPQPTKHWYAGEARIRTADGRLHELSGMWITADSLGGRPRCSKGRRCVAPEVHLALPDITRVQRRAPRRRSAALTGFAVGATLGAIGGAVGGAALSHWCMWGDCPAPSASEQLAAAGYGAGFGILVVGGFGALIGGGIDLARR